MPDVQVSSRLDVSRVFRSQALGRGLRVAIVLPMVLAVLLAFGLPKSAFLASLAVIAILVLGDFTGPRRERAASIALTAGAGAVTLALGAVLADNPVLVVVCGFLLGTVVSLLGVLRGFVTRATTPILMPYLVAATTKDATAILGQMELGWLVGSAAALFAALVMWPFYPRRRLTESLARAMAAQAGAMRALWHGRHVPEALAEVTRTGDDVRDVFTGQLARPGSSYRRGRLLVGLVEEVRRLRLALAITSIGPPLRPSAPDVELAENSAAALEGAAAAMVADKEDYEHFDRLFEARVAHRAKIVDHVKGRVGAGDGAAAVGDTLASFPTRAMSMLAMVPARDAGGLAGKGELPPLRFRGHTLPTTVDRRGPWERLRAEITWRGPWGRNAVRLGLALSLALLVVELTGVARGYWVVLGTLSVLRLDVGTTGRTAWEVVKGQVLGFGLALLVVPLANTWHPAAWIMLPLLAFAQGYAANNKSLMVQQMAFTALLVDLVMVSQPQRGVALLRLGDVLLGLTIGVVVSLLVFPRGVVPQVAVRITQAVASAAALLEAAASELANHMVGDGEEARAARAVGVDQGRARRDLERASEAVDLAISQGSSAPAVAVFWLRITNLIYYTTYVGDLMVPMSRSADPAPETVAVADDLMAAARAVGARVRTTAARALRVTELVGPETEIPTLQVPQTVPLPQIEQVRASLEAVVGHWAEERDATKADHIVHLCWALGWLTELNGAVELSNAQLDALEQELVGADEELVPQD